MDGLPEPDAPGAHSGTHTALLTPTPSAGHVCRLAEQFPRERVNAPVAHITVVTPFLPEADLNLEVYTALADIARETASFSSILAACRSFESGWYYLAPDDPAPFRELSAAVVARFPSMRPHDGRITKVIPHMSVGVEREPDRRARLMQSVAEELPIHVQVTEILLIRSGPHDWETLASFPLQHAD